MEDVANAIDPVVYAQQLGYRPWMRNGITFTGNSDQSYIGHKYAATNDNTDFVIQWSDNPAGSPWGVDRMKFVFSSAFTGVARGMGSADGMEAMRFWPSSATTVNVGVGDFAPAANNTYWRLFSGGVVAGNERGQSYALTRPESLQPQFAQRAFPIAHVNCATCAAERERYQRNGVFRRVPQREPRWLLGSEQRARRLYQCRQQGALYAVAFDRPSG